MTTWKSASSCRQGSPASDARWRPPRREAATRRASPWRARHPPYIGRLVRVVSLQPAAGNGKLEHPAADSLVFIYENPLNPAQRVRRSYPFLNFANIAGIFPQNTIARTGQIPAADGGQWILSDAPSLVVKVQPGSGSCCRVLATPANLLSPDSSRTVGIVIEASREFNLDVKVFSNLGEFVNRLAFTVSREEFPKLSPIKRQGCAVLPPALERPGLERVSRGHRRLHLQNHGHPAAGSRRHRRRVRSPPSCIAWASCASRSPGNGRSGSCGPRWRPARGFILFPRCSAASRLPKSFPRPWTRHYGPSWAKRSGTFSAMAPAPCGFPSSNCGRRRNGSGMRPCGRSRTCCWPPRAS